MGSANACPYCDGEVVDNECLDCGAFVGVDEGDGPDVTNVRVCPPELMGKTEPLPAEERPYKLTTKPCPKCLKLYVDDQIRDEMVQPVPAGAFAPFDRIDKVDTCKDCAATYGLMRLLGYDAHGPEGIQGFLMMRIAVGNDRQEHLRLPTLASGLVLVGIMERSYPGDFERHIKWLKKYVHPHVAGQEGRRHA